MARLFRKSFLLSLREKENDLTLRVPNRYVPVFWPTLFSIAFALAVLATWLFTAQLPVTVAARGVVMPLGGAREIVSFGQGMAVNRRTADHNSVLAGEILLNVSDPTAETAYEDARRAFISQVDVFVSQRRASTEKQESSVRDLTLKLENVQAKISRLKKITEAFEVASAEFDDTERTLLEAQIPANAKVNELYDEIQDGAEGLWKKRMTAATDYARLQQNRVLAVQSLTDVVTSISRSRVNKQRMLRELSELQEQVASSAAEEQELNSAIVEANHKAETERLQLDLEELNSRNKLLDEERRLWLGANIFSPYDGELVAMKISPGQLISRGEAVALISMATQHRKLMLVLSPRASGGQIVLKLNGREEAVDYSMESEVFHARLREAIQKLAPSIQFSISMSGSQVLVSSDGGKLGDLEKLEIAQVGLMDAAKVPVFAFLVVVGDEWSSQELLMVAIVRAEDAKRVREGQSALVKPDFEKSLVGSQIHSHVLQISNFVATTIEAESLIGSAEMAKAIAGETGGVAALLRFERDASGNFRLNGDTLSRPLSIGTMSAVRIQVDVASPIEVLLPFYANLFR
jgi:multidrug resistance efflux pump